MSIETLLKRITSTGTMHNVVLTTYTRCSISFNMCSLIVTQESLRRLCGYGLTAGDRYLDDQVGSYINKFTLAIIVIYL